MARRGRLLPDLGISAPSVVARILMRACDATDFRPSMNGVGVARASRRTLWESGRERWRDGAGSLQYLRISAPSGFALILVWARDATDSRPSINGGATVPVAAHRLLVKRRHSSHIPAPDVLIERRCRVESRACQRWRTGAVGSQTCEIR